MATERGVPDHATFSLLKNSSQLHIQKARIPIHPRRYMHNTSIRLTWHKTFTNHTSHSFGLPINLKKVKYTLHNLEILVKKQASKHIKKYSHSNHFHWVLSNMLAISINKMSIISTQNLSLTWNENHSRVSNTSNHKKSSTLKDKTVNVLQALSIKQHHKTYNIQFMLLYTITKIKFHSKR